MRPIKRVVIPQGVPVEGTDPIRYMPLFDGKELGIMSAELQLEKIRAFHYALGQLDILEKIDEEVELKGNPYEGKPLVQLLDD